MGLSINYFNGLTKKYSTQLRFFVVGSFNTVLDFSILFALTVFVGLPNIASNIISTLIAFLVSFALNRTFTFKSTNKNIRRQFILFTVITLFGLWVLQSIVIYILTPIFTTLGLGNSTALFASKLIATLVSLVWNYILYDRVVFKV